MTEQLIHIALTHTAKYRAVILTQIFEVPGVLGSPTALGTGKAIAVLGSVNAGFVHTHVAGSLRHYTPVALIHFQSIGVGQPLRCGVAGQAVEGT